MSVSNFLGLSLAMCFALPVMSLHSVKGKEFKHWISARIDAYSHTQISQEPTRSEPTTTSLADEAPITGGKPYVNGKRWSPSTGQDKDQAILCLVKASQCKKQGDTQCSEWSMGLNDDQMRTLETVIQASKNTVAMRMAKKSGSALTLGLLHQVSLLKMVETSRFLEEQCVDPSVENLEVWACECLDYMIDVCGGTNEECFVQQLCESSHVCSSWKETNCADSSSTASSLKQRIGRSSEIAQANVSDSHIDSSLTGSLPQPSNPGALIVAAAEQRAQVSTRSASNGGLDGTVQGKCSQ